MEVYKSLLMDDNGSVRQFDRQTETHYTIVLKIDMPNPDM